MAESNVVPYLKDKRNDTYLPPATASELAVEFPYSIVGTTTPPQWRYHFRLLKLLPGLQEQRLQGRLYQMPGHEGTPPFSALSYAWLRDGPREGMDILKDEQTYEMQVSSDLLSCLRMIRSTIHELWLFVEAICVNLLDDEDTRPVLAAIPQIYSLASDVIVWIGSETQDSHLAFEAAARIIHQETSHDLIMHSLHPTHLQAILHLLSMNFFYRAWVVQEVALAKACIIRCGHSVMSWPEFVKLVRSLKQLSRSETTFDSASTSKLLEQISVSAGCVFAELVSAAMQTPGETVHDKKSLSLESLVTSAPHLRTRYFGGSVYWAFSMATDICDEVEEGSKIIDKAFPNVGPVRTLAVRGSFSASAVEATSTVQNNEELEIIVKALKADKRKSEEHFGYSQSCPDSRTCWLFTTFAILQSQSLDIICRPWVPETGVAIPSFARSRRSAPYIPDARGVLVRSAADPLTGYGLGARSSYSAAGDTLPVIKLGWGERLTSITVRGFALDIIGSVTEMPAAEGCIPPGWTEFAGWKSSQEEPPASFWQTIVGNRQNNGDRATLVYRSTCKTAFSFSGSTSGLNTSQLLCRTRELVLRDWLKRVRAVTWMRRLFLTQDLSLYGIGTREMTIGDLIYILYGCSVPVILRRVEGSDEYKLVGECYVHNMMDGQALSLCKADRRLEAMVTLV